MSDEKELTNEENVKQSEPQTGITVNDLAAIHNIIEVACTRAAFKPDELETVGRLYNKLTSFLKQIKEQHNV